MALDVCYTLNQFCAPLPETYGDFKAMAATFLPNIIDTKVFLTLATSNVDPDPMASWIRTYKF
jgi:hypothetical protein